MLKEIKEIFVATSHNIDFEQADEKQTESLMLRGWLLHSLKTCLVAIMATSGRAYWEQEDDAETGCSPRKSFLPGDDN